MIFTNRVSEHTSHVRFYDSTCLNINELLVDEPFVCTHINKTPVTKTVSKCPLSSPLNLDLGVLFSIYDLLVTRNYWLTFTTRIVEVVSTSPIKGLRCFLGQETLPYCLVLDCSRNGFERTKIN